MTKPARFTEADVKRAIAGAIAAGVKVTGVEVNDNGAVVLFELPGAPKRRNRADEIYGRQT